MEQIATLESTFGVDGPEAFVSKQLARLPGETKYLPRVNDTAPGLHAYAEVNHGRWIVACPNPACTSAQLASATHRVYFCVDCRNLFARRRWVVVEWPTDAQRAEIEAILLARPREENRNWKPGEPIGRLRGENRIAMLVTGRQQRADL